MEINKVYCMDCLEGLKQLENESIDLILTDPPYGINKKKIKGDEDMKTIKEVIPEFYRILKPDSFFICFCSISKIKEFLLISNVFNYEWICINYINNGMVRGRLGFSAFVPVLIMSKGTPKIKKMIRDVREISTSSKKVKNFYHPYQKNELFIEDLLKFSTKQGDLVLDGFVGGGNIPYICKKLNRDYIGFEIESNYFKIANRRLDTIEWKTH